MSAARRSFQPRGEFTPRAKFAGDYDGYEYNPDGERGAGYYLRPASDGRAPRTADTSQAAADVSGASVLQCGPTADDTQHVASQTREAKDRLKDERAGISQVRSAWCSVNPANVIADAPVESGADGSVRRSGRKRKQVSSYYELIEDEMVQLLTDDIGDELSAVLSDTSDTAEIRSEEGSEGGSEGGSEDGEQSVGVEGGGSEGSESDGEFVPDATSDETSDEASEDDGQSESDEEVSSDEDEDEQDSDELEDSDEEEEEEEEESDEFTEDDYSDDE